LLKRTIPSSNEQLPVLGLGTWSTFNVQTNAMQPLQKVLDELYTAGGTLIDSSPMYGNAETIIGELTNNFPLKRPTSIDAGHLTTDFFYATKVWTTGKQAGIQQMEDSFRKMKRITMDLMQIHNLLDWKTHLKTLREWRDAGKIRYIGITHYTDSMHAELEKIISAEEIDFVQFNYFIFATNAEKHLLPLAANRGVATIINRPFGEGSAFNKVKNKELPAWAIEQGMDTWSRFFLAYIISHPAVTCVIPATGNGEHAKENFNWEMPGLPNKKMRARMKALLD